MLSYEQAAALQEVICKEAPRANVQIMTEEEPFSYGYYLVVAQAGKPRFTVRSLEQWKERKLTVLLVCYSIMLN